jgi:internalin A
MAGPTSLGRRFLTNDPGVIARFGDPFQPLEPECRVIQFDERLSPAQLERAGRLIAERPDVELYVYGRAWRDLSFLKYFKTVQRLHIALFELGDTEGFADAPWLRELTFGETRKNFSLRFVSAWPRLKKLFLVRPKTDLPCIASLTDLEDLGLSGFTLADLSILLPLVKLRKLGLFLGGTRNLSALAQLPKLEDLRLMRITKLSDLGILSDLAGLKTLHLDWLRNVTALPRLPMLEDVTLSTMKGLADLSPLAAVSTLRRLSIGEMRHLTVDSFRCFLGHPALQELRIETGKIRLDDEVKRLLPLVARSF